MFPVVSPATSPGEETESEEEKLKKDASRSEKSSGVAYFMTEGESRREMKQVCFIIC